MNFREESGSVTFDPSYLHKNVWEKLMTNSDKNVSVTYAGVDVPTYEKL